MRLGSPEFEKRFRALHRAELKESAGLRRRFRQARKTGTAGPNASRRILFTLVAALIFASWSSKITGPEFGLALISLWAAGSVFRKAHHWFQTFYGTADLLALNLLPISDQDIYRVQSRKYTREFGWVFFEFTILYLALGIAQKNLNPLIYYAPVLGALQTGLVLALSLHSVVFLHALPAGVIGGLLRAAALFFLFAGPQIPGVTAHVIRFSDWFFPTGWLNYAFAQASSKEDWIALGLLLPIGALAYAGVYSWERLRAFYSLEGLDIIPAPGRLGLSAEDLPTRGATEIQDQIGEGHFLRPLDWPAAGRLERFVSRLIRGRDRVILEFLIAENPGWTASLRGSLWVFGAGAILIYFFGEYSGFIVFFPAYLLATAALPLLGGEWRGLQQFPSGGIFIPAYAIYPVSFGEITRVMLKVNLVRTVAAAPLMLVFGMLASWKLGHGLLPGVQITCKALALFLALQPLIVLFPIAKSTNDTSRWRWPRMFIVLFLVLTLGALCLAAFFLDTAISLLVFGAVLVLSTAAFALYRSTFQRGRFDLLSTRSTDS